MLKIKLFILCFVVGILKGYFVAANEETKSTTVSLEASATSTSLTPAILATTATIDSLNEVAKDKRQVGKKDTQNYPNHRSATAEDDPEDGQETIYGPKPNQFLIRPLSPHQHQQHEEHQQTQLRNYPVTIRPHSQQLLEQSQEIQHFAYLQDLTRNHPTSKAGGATTSQRQGKAQLKKVAASRVAPPPAYNSAATTATAAEEAEQRYAYAVQPQVSQPQPQQFQQSTPYRIATAAGQPQHQHLQQQQPQQYQIIPEEQFLKIIEEELQARAYHDEQARQQQQHQQHSQQQQQQQQLSQQQQQHQHQHQQQRQYQVQAAQAQRDSANKIQLQDVAERSSPPGLGSYRQRIAEEPNDAYVQYIPRPQGAPKYLPEPQEQQQLEPTAPSAPPRLAFYTPPQLQYNHPSNHPLAKSSLEKEIEKLLVANKNSADALQFEDSSDESSAIVNHQRHHQPAPQPQPQRHQPRPSQHPKTAFISSTTPNAQVDANNQPFIPSLFQFSNYQQPTQIYSTQGPQKLGPVVYPTTAPTSQPAQPSQYYYQEARPTPSARPYRAKHYGNKIPTPSPSLKTAHEKEASKLQQKYSAPYEPYDYERQPQSQTGPVQFYPSQRDPTEQQAQPSIRPTSAAPRHSAPPPPPPPPASNYRPFVVPAAAPSQSSIYVSQSTGIKTASRPVHKAAAKKTAEDVRQLHLPPPGGKPLTQAEFQALIDAGYPVTAVPVPVPVPYEQYIKENPEYRNRPIEYPLMRLAQQYAPQAPQSQHQQRHHQQQQRSLAAPSEPAAKIVASPNESKTATGIGGGGITYLRPIEHEQQQSRRPRDEQDTAVEGAQKET